MNEHHHSFGNQASGAWFRTRWGLALIGFALISALLLVYEHRVHIPFGSILVILPLFACLGLHSLMHGGHGHGGGHGNHGRSDKNVASGPSAATRVEDERGKQS